MEVLKTRKEFKEVEITEDHYYQCDRCGKRIETELFEVFESTFEIKTGSSYPSGGHGETKYLDLCQLCSEDVFNILKSNGFNFQFKDWDY